MANVVVTFVAKTRDFLRGTEKLERATDDIADSLDTAQREADRFEDEFTAAMRSAQRAADRASDSVEDSFLGLPDEMGDIGQDAGGEFVQNIGEAVSSGDIEGLISGTLGGIVSGLKGPMGLAAAGLAGVAVVAFQQARKEAEELAAFAASYTESMLGVVYQTRDAINEAAVDAAYQSFLQDNQDKLNEFAPLLDTLQIDAETFWKTLFADPAGANDLLGYLSQIVDAGYAAEMQDGDESLIAAKDAARQLIPEVQRVVDAGSELEDSASNYADALGDDVKGALDIAREDFVRFDRFIRDQAAIPVRQRIEIVATVTGDGAAYVNRTPPQYSPGHVANNNPYRNTGGNRAR